MPTEIRYFEMIAPFLSFGHPSPDGVYALTYGDKGLKGNSPESPAGLKSGKARSFKSPAGGFRGLFLKKTYRYT
jgi:hypothetical protein